MASESAATMVVISSSCQHGAYYKHLPVDAVRGFNEDLPTGSRGFIFSNQSSEVNIFAVVGEDDTTRVTPFIAIAGGVVHPIAVKRFVNSSAHKTTARNIVVLY